MKKLLIVGSARCLWDDLKALGHWSGDIMAVNYAGCFLPRPFQHWVSIHAENFRWMPYINHKSKKEGGAPKRFFPRFEARYHTARPDPEAILSLEVWPEANKSGDSGLFAVSVGLRLGYEEVVLCGVPQDGERHFYDPPHDEEFYEEWCTDSIASIRNDYAHLHIAWKMASREMAGRVKSMSGFTRDLLGGP